MFLVVHTVSLLTVRLLLVRVRICCCPPSDSGCECAADRGSADSKRCGDGVETPALFAESAGQCGAFGVMTVGRPACRPFGGRLRGRRGGVRRSSGAHLSERGHDVEEEFAACGGGVETFCEGAECDTSFTKVAASPALPSGIAYGTVNATLELLSSEDHIFENGGPYIDLDAWDNFEEVTVVCREPMLVITLENEIVEEFGELTSPNGARHFRIATRGRATHWDLDVDTPYRGLPHSNLAHWKPAKNPKSKPQIVFGSTRSELWTAVVDASVARATRLQELRE